MTDDKRRLTMPKELPPKSAVTIQQVSENSWLVVRQKPKTDLVVVAFPIVKDLPRDAEWQATEKRIAKHLYRKLPPFEE